MFCSELHSQSLAIDGTFTQEGSTLQFNFKLTLNEKAENIYSGKFEWTLINADRKDPYSFNYFSNRLGLISIEYVNGKYDSITNSLKLIGYKKDDPFEIIGLDEYNLNIDINGNVTGTSLSNGANSGIIKGNLIQISGKEFESFDIKTVGVFDDNFYFSDKLTPPSLPWLKVYPEFNRTRMMSYFCAFIIDGKYLAIVSATSHEYLLETGLFIDLWDTGKMKYLGRSSLENPDASAYRSYFREFVFMEESLTYDFSSKIIYLSFYKGDRERKYQIPFTLNQTTSIYKKNISDFKGKKYLKGISNLRKTESFHCHYHKHGESMILNNDYYFKGSPEVMKNPILKWSNVTESITIKKSQGIRSTTDRNSDVWELMLTRPEPKATALLSLKQNQNKLIAYIKNLPLDDYYFKKAKELLFECSLDADSYSNILKELPQMRETVFSLISIDCFKKYDKKACQLIVEAFREDSSWSMARNLIKHIEESDLISSIKFSPIEVLVSTEFKNADFTNNRYEPLIFNEVLIQKGNLKYLLTTKVNNPTSQTISFIAEVELGVARSESVGALGLSVSKSSNVVNFKEYAVIPKLKAGETRDVAFLIDLGFQDIKSNYELVGTDIKKYFEIRNKSIKAIPLKSEVQSISANLFKQISWNKIAELNFPGKFKSIGSILEIKSDQHYIDIKKKVFKKAAEIDPLYKNEASRALSKELEGVWLGKYSLTDIAEFEIKATISIISGNYFDGYFECKLVKSKCSSLAVLYGETFHFESYGCIENNNLVFSKFNFLADRYRIWTSVATCRELDNSNGIITNVNNIIEDFVFALNDYSHLRLLESDSLAKVGKKFNLQLTKIQGIEKVRQIFDEQNKIIAKEKKNLNDISIKVKRADTNAQFTVVGLLALIRDESDATSKYLFGIVDPLSNVYLIVNKKKYKLKYYSGISIKNSENLYPYYQSNLVNCKRCGILYRYFELYFEPIPLKDRKIELIISNPKYELDFSPIDFNSEYTGLTQPFSLEEIHGFDLDKSNNYISRTSTPNCKCFHPTTQELTDVWVSYNLNCKNGLVNGKRGLVNFPNAVAYSENWVNGKANGMSSNVSRMHPNEPPKKLPTGIKNFQTVTSLSDMENNIDKSFTDKEFGWQVGLLFESYIKAYVFVTGSTDGIMSGFETEKPSSPQANSKPNTKVDSDNRCVLSVKEDFSAFVRCSAKVKDPVYKVLCKNNKTKYFYYIPIVNNSGLCSDQIGYYEHNQFFVNFGEYLGNDREKALKKLCGCD
jgi:hypothetical protein